MSKGFTHVLLVAILLCHPGWVLAKTSKKASADEPEKLSLPVVKQVVKSKIVDVQKCYTDLIIEGMAKAGTVAVTWDIDDKGAVQNLNIKENTSGDQALAGCVTERVQSWTFPPAAEGATFSTSYSFKFGN